MLSVRRRAFGHVLCLITLQTVLATVASGAPQATPLPPIDPQKVQDQDDMSWKDYNPIPGIDWVDTTRAPSERTIRVAVILCDFPDQEFVVTMKKNSDLFGNPQIDPVKREDVAKFYADFWNGRSPHLNRHTVNEYWMEQSHGKIGVSMVPFGPYRMPRKSFQYGLSGFGQNQSAPPADPVGGNMTGDCDQLWTADAGNVRADFNLVLRIFAGYDETCVWQEFGEMKFQTRDDIPPEWGNPDPTMPRWVPTRYTPWTSWKAGQWLWSNSAIIQGESSGSIYHEISHAAFSIGDNNNNPYVTPYRRVGSGPWDIMDRGSFNGPGGPHDRWQIPVSKGGAAPAGVMLRNKLHYDFVRPENLGRLSRDGLAKSGPAVFNVIARSAVPGPNGISGVVVQLDGTPVAIPPQAQGGGGRGGGGRGGRGRGAPASQPEGGPGTAPGTPTAPGRGPEPFALVQEAPGAAAPGTVGQVATQPGAAQAARGGRGGRGGGRGRSGTGSPSAPGGQTFDRTPWVDPATNPLSPGVPDFNTYTVEVVQRMGFDSFCPDSGVLLAMNKDQPSSNGGPNAYTCFNWVIDAHPEDIKKLDFKRPNGEEVMRTVADYRQLNDALFHAGLNSGSQAEHIDEPNRLHFYIVDMKKDAGVMTYTVGVRSLDGAGPQQRGLNLTAAARPLTVNADHTPAVFTLTNTGAAAETEATLHPRDMRANLGNDIYRLKASINGQGWTAQLNNALAAVPFGKTQDIPVFVSRGQGAARTATVTLTATSESDPTKTKTVEYTVGAP